MGDIEKTTDAFEWLAKEDVDELVNILKKEYSL